VSKIRDVYERAISQVPLVKEKLYWQRYIYLWIFYALWEENVAEVIFFLFFFIKKNRITKMNIGL
jgi:hypothetical protein